MYSKSILLKAKSILENSVHSTPILKSHLLNELIGCELFFKCENFQKAGAFKMRGAMHKLLSLSIEEREKGVATHSSGNFGSALALSAQILGIPATIIMPSNAPQVKKNAVAAYGATIIECEPTLEARESTTAAFIDKSGATSCHPYNDSQVILGNSTAAQEIFEELIPDAIITPVGGGGLMSGTALACEFFSPSTLAFGAEPEGADDAFRSIRDGIIHPSINPQTIADGLRTSLGEHTFPIIRDKVEEIFLVNDDEIKSAMRLIWERMKIIVEPSSAITFAAVLKNKEIFKNQKVALILSGGNVDLEKFFQ
ncbi:MULTISPECIES: threonine/serine dehydratase [unclassified Lentimicrobium]|uniref:threonine/serine dehydratase n=1 Tax=unclassified Lentimicrobium TaxID=2677434 RepID=UPI001555B9D2|nr:MULTISPECIES: threonine/serine dehydratase [unclassified Lentimicrobium]NPD47827.1 threonine/serine dehydratase [Lentimicrobium sp. S6]NPD86698.1 threonine/serine dehydratase [Lentimicrobium sp. L6]